MPEKGWKSISVKDALFERAKVIAGEKGLTLNDLLDEALRVYKYND